jgi:hypothetical protein
MLPVLTACRRLSPIHRECVAAESRNYVSHTHRDNVADALQPKVRIEANTCSTLLKQEKAS